MFSKNSMIKSVLFGLVAALVVVGVAGYTSALAQDDDGQVVTVTGYVTQYIGDDNIMFTDGKNTVQVEVEDFPRDQLPLNTPLTITAKIENDDGKLEAKIMSVEPAGEAGTGTGAAATPPAELPITTVADINAAPADDKLVVVQGQITQQVAGDKYLFSDGTGMIVLDVDDDLPPNSVPLNQPVLVFGEVEVDDGKVEIDVKGIVPAASE